jgi:hypothetical protein
MIASQGVVASPVSAGEAGGLAGRHLTQNDAIEPTIPNALPQTNVDRPPTNEGLRSVREAGILPGSIAGAAYSMLKQADATRLSMEFQSLRRGFGLHGTATQLSSL